MTMGRTEFDGDSPTSVRYFLGMTVLFDARSFLDKFQFVSVLTKADSLNTNLGVPQSILRQALS